MKVIIDAENCVAGRLSSFAAKQALQGKEVSILNAEKAFIIGTKESILYRYMTQKQRGKAQKQRGPHLPSTPERLLKRIIRGMMKYKEGRGKIAFKKIKCYNGVPNEFEKSEKIVIHKIEGSKKGLNLKQLAQLLKVR